MTVITEGGSATPLALGCPRLREAIAHIQEDTLALGPEDTSCTPGEGGRSRGHPKGAAPTQRKHHPCSAKPSSESYGTELKLRIKNSGGEAMSGAFLLAPVFLPQLRPG